MTATNREADIVTSFIAFADRLVEDFDLLDLTIELTEDCARLLDVDAAGLLLADAGGRLHLLAATSEQARRVEVFQLQQEEGPCLDCYRAGEPVAVPELSNEYRRWPRFVSAATAGGFVSVHAIPMRLQGEVLGALGLFGTSGGTLNHGDQALARAFAHVASIAIAQQHRSASRAALLPDLQAAVASRGILEVAKGIVAAAHTVDMQEAFTRLRRLAHVSKQPLSELARRLVEADGPTRASLSRTHGTGSAAALTATRQSRHIQVDRWPRDRKFRAVRNPRAGPAPAVPLPRRCVRPPAPASRFRPD